MIIVKDVISTDLCDMCIQEMKTVKDWQTSNTWQPHLQEGYSGICHQAMVSTSIKLKVLASVRKFLPKLSHDKFIVQYHNWKVGSGIQWHTDDVYKLWESKNRKIVLDRATKMLKLMTPLEGVLDENGLERDGVERTFRFEEMDHEESDIQ